MGVTDFVGIFGVTVENNFVGHTMQRFAIFVPTQKSVMRKVGRPRKEEWTDS